MTIQKRYYAATLAVNVGGGAEKLTFVSSNATQALAEADAATHVGPTTPVVLVVEGYEDIPE